MKNIFIFFLFALSFLNADAIKLFNNSPFELNAIIQSANGKVVAQKKFAPDEQAVWSTDQMSTDFTVSYDASSSYTPYTVIWRCSYEGYYSVCTDVAAGAMVMSNSCPGSKFCKPKPKKDKTQNTKETSCRTCRPKRRVLK